MAATSTIHMLGPTFSSLANRAVCTISLKLKTVPCPGYKEAGALDPVAMASPQDAFVLEASWLSCVLRTGHNTR